MSCAAGRAVGSVTFGREEEANSWGRNASAWRSCSEAVADPS